MSMKRQCPVPGCGETLKWEQHLCAMHWNRIPGTVARRIVKAHRELLHRTPGALSEYQAAIGEACTIIGAKVQSGRGT